MGEEKRNLVRWKVNWPAKLRFKYNNSIKNYECIVNDINFKGFQATLKKKLPEGKTLKFAIVLKDGAWLKVKAEIESQSALADGTSVYNFLFINIPDEDKERFYQLINKNYFPELRKLWWKDVK
jgi:hypothetical protein